MTPGARIAAAIEVLDRWQAGEPAESAGRRGGERGETGGGTSRSAGDTALMGECPDAAEEELVDEAQLTAADYS